MNERRLGYHVLEDSSPPPANGLFGLNPWTEPWFSIAEYHNNKDLIHFQDAPEKWIVFVEARVQRHFVPRAVIIEQLFEREQGRPDFVASATVIPDVNDHLLYGLA